MLHKQLFSSSFRSLFGLSLMPVRGLRSVNEWGRKNVPTFNNFAFPLLETSSVEEGWKSAFHPPPSPWKISVRDGFTWTDGVGEEVGLAGGFRYVKACWGRGVYCSFLRRREAAYHGLPQRTEYVAADFDGVSAKSRVDTTRCGPIHYSYQLTA